MLTILQFRPSPFVIQMCLYILTKSCSLLIDFVRFIFHYCRTILLSLRNLFPYIQRAPSHHTSDTARHSPPPAILQRPLRLPAPTSCRRSRSTLGGEGCQILLFTFILCVRFRSPCLYDVRSIIMLIFCRFILSLSADWPPSIGPALSPPSGERARRLVRYCS